MGVALPVAFLEAAAPGYLAGADWDGLGEDWLEQALAYAAAPCKGVRGPLTRIRPRPPGKAAEPGYRLADYLDQHGRRAHRGLLPPAGFWDARPPRPTACCARRPDCASTPLRVATPGPQPT